MVNMTCISIWTEADRFCKRCAVQVAQPDDWLCQRCRSKIEADWLRIITNNFYPSVNLAPSRRVHSSVGGKGKRAKAPP